MFNLVDCSINISRTLMFIHIGVHLLALVSVIQTDVEVFVKIVCSLLIVLIFKSSYQQYVSLSSPESVVSLTWLPNSKVCKLKLLCGSCLEVNSIHQRLVLPFMIFILANVDNRLGKMPVLVFLDSCDKESFRRLKVLVSFSHVDEH